MKTLINITLAASLSALTAQGATLVQELNADDITAVTNGSTWTARTGANATLNDNSAVGGSADLSKDPATVNGGATSSVFANTLSTGAYGNAAQMGAYLDPLSGTTVSIELWISPLFSGAPANSQTIFETGGEGRGMSITLGDNGDGDFLNNNLRFALKDGGGTTFVDYDFDAAAMTAFTDGHHHQLAVTYDNVNNMLIYIDGAQVASNIAAGVKDWDGTSPAGIWGTDGSGVVLTDTLDADGEGHGSVAVFRHYSDVLTGAEVLQNYASTISIPEPGTAALFAGCFALTSIMVRRRR